MIFQMFSSVGNYRTAVQAFVLIGYYFIVFHYILQLVIVQLEPFQLGIAGENESLSMQPVMLVSLVA